MLPDLYVLRHGQTEWNLEGRLQGHLDSPLTTRGLQQARMQRAILSAVLPETVSVLSSPSPRARRTAEIALAGHQIVTDRRLMEIDLGEWTGRLIDEISPATGPSSDPHLWKFDAPGGEGLDRMVTRCAAVLSGIEGPTVLVTHGVTSRILRCLALWLPPTELSRVPGGQGVVHRISGGQAEVLGDID